MKPIIVLRDGREAARKRYAIARMTAAARRLLAADTMAEEIQAGQWALAWAIIAGARPSGRKVS